MLLQTLPLLAMIFLVGFGLVTSQLVAVRYSVQRAASRDVGLAVDGAVIDVTRNVANYVRDNGSTEGPWKSPVGQSPRASACAEHETGQVCLYTTYHWRFTGSSRRGFPDSGSGSGAGQSKAVNLQTALIDEQRVSVHVIASISSAKGDVLAERTRDVTFRVFNAAPYAVVVGSYDVTSQLGAETATQGDTGGNLPFIVPLNGLPVRPDFRYPDNYRDTTLHVSLTCQNSAQNSNQTIPYVDNHPAYLGENAPNLPWGVRGFAYEVPCDPQYARESPPAGAPQYPIDQNYTLSRKSLLDNESWKNGETNSGTWVQ